jgi:hypothetical protein
MKREGVLDVAAALHKKSNGGLGHGQYRER